MREQREKLFYSRVILQISIIVFVFFLGFGIRGWAIFRNGLIPAVNGAYYLVQARSILRTGWLGMPDFPLVFYIQAGVGKLFTLFTPLDRALLASVRLTDAVLPALCAIPIIWFSRLFDDQKDSPKKAAWATLMAGSLAVGAPNLLRMVGDFQKNSSALPLFLFYTYYLYESFRNPLRKNYVLTLLFFTLVCLTHLGVAAMTIAFTVCFLLIHAANRSQGKQIAAAGLLLIFILAGAMIVVSFYDPTRVGRLAFAALSPLRMFSQSILFQAFHPGGGPPNEIGGLLLGNVLGILGLIAIYQRRTELAAETRALLLSASLCALFLASPSIHADLSSRFGLMSYIPGLIPFVYFIQRNRRGVLVGGIVTAIALAHSIAFSFQIHPTLSRPGYEELVSFKNDLTPGKNLILTKHGLEWWVAWTMDTQIARSPKIVLDAWDRYDAAFEIEEIASGPNDFTNPPPPPGSPRNDPPQDRPPRDGQPPRGPQPGMTPFFDNPNQKPPGLPDGNSKSEFQTTLIREGQYFRLLRLNRTNGGI